MQTRYPKCSLASYVL